MGGTVIEFPSNGHTCSGYLAVPASGRGPGVVVIQEWWGLVPHIRDVCDRLAAAGFTALAPDLYHGETTTEPDEAGKKLMALRIDVAARDMSGAVSWLLTGDHAEGDRVAVIGFCMGGGLAIILGGLRSEVAAVAAFYPVIPWEDARPDLAAIGARVLLHWGGHDGWNTPEKVADFEGRMRGAGVNLETFTYDADHAFFNDDRPEVYSAADATLAWDRSLALLRTTLT